MNSVPNKIEIDKNMKLIEGLSKELEDIRRSINSISIRIDRQENSIANLNKEVNNISTKRKLAK